jgi:glycosyltransferase involved in cell wall biosynthesis
MATHGRETAVAKYDWRVLGEDLAKVLEAVASGAS